jgi:5-methylcytosine-specific restriction endonuclease McrA
MNQETLVFTTSPKKEVKVNRPAVYEAGPIGGVFLLNHDKSPLIPVTNDRARWLLDNKQAAVYRRYPFTLILNKSHQSLEQAYPIEFKVDPGSKTTGLALVAYIDGKYTVIWAANLRHRGDIKSGLESRLSIRRGRRNRHTRYRPARFMNRVGSKKEGWLALSLLSRVRNVANWLTKLRKYVPITSVAVESVRFDMQKLRNPEINGVGYQQGELMGYEVREYLLEKFNRKCAYCGKDGVKEKGVKLQIEHVTPRSRGGADSVSNLVIACQKCNQKKGSQSIEEFLASRTDDLKKKSRPS